MEGVPEIPIPEPIPTLKEKIAEFQDKSRLLIDTCSRLEPKVVHPPFDFLETDSVAQEIIKLHSELLSLGEELKNAGNEDLTARVSVLETMIFVDAGFTHPKYLDQVLSDLRQDATNVIKIEGSETRDRTGKIVALAINKVRFLISGKGTEVAEVDYGLDEIEEGSGPEIDPVVDLVQEVKDANSKAYEENPKYKESKDGGLMAVWRQMSDNTKRSWNYKLWNPKLLLSPDALDGFMNDLPGRRYNKVPTSKKIKIDKPGK